MLSRSALLIRARAMPRMRCDHDHLKHPGQRPASTNPSSCGPGRNSNSCPRAHVTALIGRLRLMTPSRSRKTALRRDPAGSDGQRAVRSGRVVDHLQPLEVALACMVMVSRRGNFNVDAGARFVAASGGHRAPTIVPVSCVPSSIRWKQTVSNSRMARHARPPSPPPSVAGETALRGRPGPENDDPGHGGERHVDPHHVGGQVQLVLDAAHQPLGGEQHAEHGQRLQRVRGGAAVAVKEPDPDNGHTEHRGDGARAGARSSVSVRRP